LRLALSAALFAFILISCAGGQRPPLEALSAAARKVDQGGGDGRELALAAWNAWLVRGDADRMEALAERALREDAAEPWAWLAFAEVAKRRLDPAGEVAALGRLIEGAPAHPLAAVAAGRLAALSRRSIELDDEIERIAGERLAATAGPGAGRRLDPEASDRLRSALRHIHTGRGRWPAAEQAASPEPRDPPQAGAAIAPSVRDAGTMTAASLVGPFSPWQNLDRERAFPPQLARTIPDDFQGFGGDPLPLRPFSLPDGWLSLAPEDRGGNVYYALAVARVPAAGTYDLRLTTSSSTSASVFVDGVEVVGRSSLGAPQPRVGIARLELGAGPHLVALRLVRGGGSDGASLRLTPGDGSASRIEWRAAAAGDGPGTPPSAKDVRRPTGARSIASALEREVGILAAYVAALDSRSVDPEGSKEVLAGALEVLPQSVPLLGLRARMARADHGLPEAVGQARAAADLEALLRVDPANPGALTDAASLLRAAGRHEDALEKLDLAEAAAPDAPSIALARARIARSRGFDAQALDLALAAEKNAGRDCAVGELIFELARRSNAARQVEEVAEAYASCPGGRSRLTSVLADRGDAAQALALARELLRDDPQSPSANLRLADRLVAGGDPAAAAQVIAALEEVWPRSAHWPRRRAELLERAGDLEGADAARARALRLDGSDLRTRRGLALREGAPDLLATYDRDGLEVIRSFEAAPRDFDTPTVVLFDFAAVEVYPDGSMIERVHLVSKVLEKSGIDELGEAMIPGGAEVIHLRTIKADGRILEPEDIAGKESISLPNLEVGDYVEVQYLDSVPSRGPALPGWSAATFYFRSQGVPLLDSTYVVRAHKDAGLELDFHGGARGGEVVEDGEFLTVVMRQRNNQPLIPEPDSVNLDEVLPWVQAGSGAGEGDLAAFLADGLAATQVRSFEVVSWARAIASEVRGDRMALVRAIYERTMEEIEGSDTSFGSSPSQILARKRGNRLPLIKAALDELGIESRYAVLRTFDQAPGPMRFPRFSRLRHMVLAVRPEPSGGLVWLDPSMRWAPFGEVAPMARGVPGFLLTHLDAEKIVATSSPFGADAPQGREVELDLTLSAEGELEGRGDERYLGFDAAWMREAIERLDEGRRRQVIEAALARSFRGLVLEELEVDSGGPSGSPLGLRYRFRVPDYAHSLGDGLVAADLDFFAAQLGRRYLALSERETPLLLRAPERVKSRIVLSLPEGAAVVGGPEAARELGLYGSYTRGVALTPGKLTIQEDLRIDRGRVMPQEYREFAGWVMAVDRAQAAELILSLAKVPSPLEQEEAPSRANPEDGRAAPADPEREEEPATLEMPAEL